MNARHGAFSQRLKKACDEANVPPRNFGRLAWLRDKLSAQYGCQVTVEAVRKWLAGETLPRKRALSGLAGLLSVDEGWLYSGSSHGMREKAAPFDHRNSQGEPTKADPDFLGRIRQRFAGAVTIMPGVDLTDPTWEEETEPYE